MPQAAGEFRRDVVDCEARPARAPHGHQATAASGSTESARPSRASTLINYVGLDDGILDCVLRDQGLATRSASISRARSIPVVDEAALFDDQPEYALLLSWHIADELMPKLRERGFRGKFIVPLPEPRIVSA